MGCNTIVAVTLDNAKSLAIFLISDNMKYTQPLYHFTSGQATTLFINCRKALQYLVHPLCRQHLVVFVSGQMHIPTVNLQ